MNKNILYAFALLTGFLGQPCNALADNQKSEATQTNSAQENIEKKTEKNNILETVAINSLKVCFFGQCIGYKMLKNVGHYFSHDFGTHFGNILFPYAIVEGIVGVVLLATPPLPVFLYWLKNSSPSTWLDNQQS